MTMTLSGSGTITGLVAGGLPDATVTQPELATGVAGTGPAFSAYLNSSQTISSAVAAKITFDTELFDTNSNFSSSKFTPTVAGYYQITVCCAVGTTTTSHGLQTGIWKNGSQYVWGNLANANTAIYPYATCSSIVYLNGSTDYVEGYVYGSIGATFNPLTGSAATYFQGSLVRAA